MNKICLDRYLIYLASFLRSMAFGMLAVLTIIYLLQLNLSKTEVGIIISLGLAGAAFGNIIATFLGDHFGRKNILIVYALLSAVSGFFVAFSSSFYTISLAAFFGMLNARGKDRGVAHVLETAILPNIETNQNRTKSFAWYSIVHDVGLAIGGILAGLPSLLMAVSHIDKLFAFQITFAVYAFSMLITALFYLKLTKKVEAPSHTIQWNFTQESRKIMFKIGSLFALDSVAGGFLTSGLISYYLYERFNVGIETLGFLFFIARCFNAISYLGSVWLSKRIGLIKTMVFTHSPSHLLIIAVALSPTFYMAVAFYLIREFLVEMDVPTKQSYVMAIVKPEERTMASGMTHIVRMVGWALAPVIAGLVMQHFSSVAPLFIGAGLKLIYDALMFVSFSRVKPPEESATTKLNISHS